MNAHRRRIDPAAVDITALILERCTVYGQAARADCSGISKP